MNPFRAETFVILLPETAAIAKPEPPTVFSAAKLPLYQPVPVTRVDPKDAVWIPSREIGDDDAI